jgi:uncharacterized protein (DUF433 family)
MPRASVDDLIRQYVQADSLLPGVEEARIVGFGIPVWALIGHYQATGEDPEGLAFDYGIPLDAVTAGLAYYERHTCAIDARLAANAA